jgi:hypothetical protein
VEEAFMARCAHTLWPAYRPAATPAELTTYCRCVLREQERDWDLEEYNEEWTKVDAGYYATPREVLGVFPSGGAHYPDELIEAISHCLTAHDRGEQ